jgi:hypothetical protein
VCAEDKKQLTTTFAKNPRHHLLFMDLSVTTQTDTRDGSDPHSHAAGTTAGKRAQKGLCPPSLIHRLGVGLMAGFGISIRKMKVAA